MAIKSVPREPVSFTPAYNGNREDSNPLWIKLKFLTRGEADVYSQKTRFTQKKGFRGEWESNTSAIQKRQFLDNVLEVHNFLDSATNEEITEIDKFYNEAPFDLIEEITNAILDVSQLTEEDTKNS